MSEVKRPLVIHKPQRQVPGGHTWLLAATPEHTDAKAPAECGGWQREMRRGAGPSPQTGEEEKAGGAVSTREARDGGGEGKRTRRRIRSTEQLSTNSRSPHT